MKAYMLNEYRFDDLKRLLAGLRKVIDEHHDEPYFVVGYLQTSLMLLEDSIKAATPLEQADLEKLDTETPATIQEEERGPLEKSIPFGDVDVVHRRFDGSYGK